MSGKNLKVNLIANTSQFKSAMTQTSNQIKLINSEFKKASAETDKYGNKIDSSAAKQKQLSNVIGQYKNRITAIKNEQKHWNAELKKGNVTETQHAQKQQELARRLNNTQAEMKKYEGQLKRMNAEGQKATKTYAEFDQQFRSVGNNLRSIGMSVGIVTGAMFAGLVVPMKEAVDTAMDFQSGMSEVEALSGATGNSLKNLTKTAKHLGETTVFTARQASEGMKYLALAGWDAEQIIKGMPGMLNLAAAGSLDLARAADITSDTMQAFGMEAELATHAADVFAYAQANANTNVEQLGEGMKYLSPVANTLGWTLEQSASALMTFADSGVKGSMGGRAFATSLARLAKPSDEMIGVMEELNLKFFDANGTMKSMPKVVKEVEKATKGMSDEQKSATLTTLFGAEAYKHWAILLDRGSDALAETTIELENADGAAEKMAKTMLNNAKGKIELFKSAVEGLKISLGEQLLPALGDVTEKGTDIVDGFNEMDNATKKTIMQTSLMAAGVLGLTTVLAGLVAGVGALMAFAGPIGLAIVGGTALVAALGVAIYGATKHVENSKEVTVEHAESLADQATELENSKNAFDELSGKAKISNEELARMSDLNERIKNTSNKDELRVLKDEYNALAKESGLSKDEIKSLFDANDTIIKQSPDIEKSISTQGNAFAKNTEEIDKLIQKLREKSETELELQRANLLDEEKETLKEIKKIKSDIEKNEERAQFFLENRNLSTDELYKKEQALEEKRFEERKQKKDVSQLDEQINDLHDIRLGKQDKVNERIQKEGTDLESNLEKRELEVEKLSAIEEQLVNVKLQNVGIKEEGQEGLTVLNEQIEKNDIKLRQLTDEQVKNGSLTEEQQAQYDKLVNKTSEMEKARDAIYEEYDLMGSVNSLVDSQVKNLSNGTQEKIKQLEKTHEINVAEGEVFTQLQKKQGEYVKERNQLEENLEKQGANKDEINKQIKALDEKIATGDAVSANILEELGLLEQVGGKIKFNSEQLESHLVQLGYTTEEAKKIAFRLTSETTSELKKGTEEAGEAGKDKGESFYKGLESKKTAVELSAKELLDITMKRFKSLNPESKKAGEDKGENFDTGLNSTKPNIMRTTDDIITDLKKNFNKGDSEVNKSGENKGVAHEKGINSTYGKNMTASLGISTGVTKNLGSTTDGGGGSKAGSMFSGGLAGWIQRVRGSGESVASSGVRGLRSVSTSGAGDDFVSGFRLSISRGSVWDAAWSLGKSALGALKKSINSNSPSKETGNLGDDYVDGFGNSIKNGIRNVTRSAELLGKESVKSLGKSLNNNDDLALQFTATANEIRKNKDKFVVEHKFDTSNLESKLELINDNKQENKTLKQVLEATLQQNNLLMKILQKSADVNIDGRKVTDTVNHHNAMQALNSL